MDSFTFIVISYNQERYILETLESIKYQVERYGEGHKFQIIIADDNSTDRTYFIEKLWIKKNGYLFYESLILPSDRNRGINANYLRAFSFIKSEFYKVIAGDDLIADIDLSSIIKKKGIYITSFLFFNEKGIIKERDCYMDQYQFFDEKLEKIRRISAYLYPFYTQSWILFKEYNNEKMLNMMSRYRFMEDKPQWYRLMKDGQVKIYYYNVPLVLYRKSENGVSNVNSPFNKTGKEDLLKFYADIIREEKNFIKKMILFLYKKEREQNCLFFKLINPYKYYIFIDRKNRINKMKKFIDELQEKFIKSNTEYLNMIGQRAHIEYDEIIRILDHEKA